MVTLIEKGIHQFHDYIIPKPICTGLLRLCSTNVDIEVIGIAIGAVCQYPEFDSSLSGLVLSVLPNS